MKKYIIITSIVTIILLGVIWWRAPLLGNDLNKQTIYVSLIDIWYGWSTDKVAYAMWTDDDSGIGVFDVKNISDSVGIKPVFSVIAENMNKAISDSLATWQKQGAKIILHGLRHERWQGWNSVQIEADLNKSLEVLHAKGFDTTQVLKIIVPPHACNTNTIRDVIKSRRCQMITGASLVNPDRNVFQLGRINILPDTDTNQMRGLLERAYQRKAFVVFCTHSSIPKAFSIEKTTEIIELAKKIGFNFNIDE